MLNFYLATAARVYELHRPGETLTSHLAPVTYKGLHFENRHTAQDWRLAEADCLLATARQVVDEDTLGRAVDAGHTMCWPPHTSILAALSRRTSTPRRP